MATRITLDLTPVGWEDGRPQDYLALPEGAQVPAAAGLRRRDFRIHGGCFTTGHWLLSHPYGRDLLISKVRLDHPGLLVPRYRIPADLEPLLDSAIDALDLRDWPAPRTLRERFKAAALLVRYGFRLSAGLKLPTWRAEAMTAA